MPGTSVCLNMIIKNEAPVIGRCLRERALAIPPQVVHDLAGARHETLLFVETQGPALTRDAAADAGTVHSLLASIAGRERAVAQRIAEHRAVTKQREGPQ